MRLTVTDTAVSCSFKLVKKVGINDLTKTSCTLSQWWWEGFKNKQNRLSRVGLPIKSVGEVASRRTQKATMDSVLRIFVLGCISAVGSIPFPEDQQPSRSLDTSFIGKGTNELATALLQGYVQKEENMVYSPFGYSAILAIFSEGARGASRDEIAEALYFPKDPETVREAYRSVLERLVGRKNSNSPEFKNWYYIYKNYTVKEDIQNLLRKYYLTEVKYVDRPETYITATKKAPIEMTDVEGNKKSEVDMPEKAEPEKSDLRSVKEEEKPLKAMEETKKEEEGTMTKAEKPMEEAMKAEENEKKMSEESERKDGEQKTMEEKKEGQVEMMGPLKTNVEIGLMPVEHFSGMTDSSLRIRGEESKPQMVIFNGLYYKGEWETPFEKKPADDTRVFYKSENEKIFVSTIHSQGVFNFGTISNLDCRAIELPYKGGRYSLLILVPNSRSGLSKLVSDLSGYPFRTIYEQLTEKLVDVCLPSFEINTISKPISASNKFGLNKVTSIFSPEKADLSNISGKESGLYVEELVQMVTFKVDAGNTETNFLTASIASSRSNVETFRVNQPFLFYLRDNLDDIIIVNGKVIDPTPKPDFYFS